MIIYFMCRFCSIHRTINIDTTTIIDNIDLFGCPICYTNNVEYQLNCKHSYCSTCINKHYTQKTNCPLCRDGIIKCYPIKIIIDSVVYNCLVYNNRFLY